MVYLRMRARPYHLLPLAVLAPIVLVAVDLGAAFDMPRWLATLVYCAQCLMSCAVYYLVLLFQLMDLEGTYPQPALIRALMRLGMPMLSYFMFACRVALLSFLEAASLSLLLLQFGLASSDTLQANAPLWLLPSGLAPIAAHVWFERRNLGQNGFQVEQAISPTLASRSTPPSRGTSA